MTTHNEQQTNRTADKPVSSSTTRELQQMVDQLKEAVHQALDERDGIDRDRHAAEHDFVRELIDQKRRRIERWEKIKAQVGGWAVISFLSGLAYLAWSGFQLILRKTGH